MSVIYLLLRGALIVTVVGRLATERQTKSTKPTTAGPPRQEHAILAKDPFEILGCLRFFFGF